MSIILLDWGVRESLHLLHYLNHQTIPRDSFEVILVEYYDIVSEQVKKFESEIDTWILLEMPLGCYYHKHLMYNAGIAFSRGEILMFGDSDAMVRPTFVATILKTFERDRRIVYHMDEFRNVRRDFYPFNYPSFDDVLGDGCINDAGGKTKGIVDQVDPMHTRNYGACMCARREDIIAIGGADEDLTYLGHVCGPYDMTFRLMNAGLRLVWETDEYLYHTWHPGSDGIDNYLGPHDGKNMSTTAFQALNSGRIPPQVENEAIRRLRTESPLDVSSPEFANLLINPAYREAFDRTGLGGPVMRPAIGAARQTPLFASYRGFDFYRLDGTIYAVQPHLDPETIAWDDDERVLRGHSFNEIRDIIDRFDARYVGIAGPCNIYALEDRFVVVPHTLGNGDFRLRSYRENPQIIWADSIGEAQKAAEAIPVPTLAPALASSDLPATAESGIPQDVARVEQRIADLEQRVFAAEQDLSKIYASRTWRAITAAGGIIQRILGLHGDNGR